VTIKDELVELQRQANGLLQVETAVEWAESHPDSALHKSLDWDDETAGHEWRCHQIRRLIAVHIVNGDRARETVSLTIDRNREGGGYRLISDVISTPDMRRVLLQDALDELERVKRKYESLTELAKVWEEAHRVRQKHAARKKKEEKQPHSAA
jgi:hypothetical protein